MPDDNENGISCTVQIYQHYFLISWKTYLTYKTQLQKQCCTGKDTMQFQEMQNLVHG
jgi:hypothetical protein